MYGLLDDTNNLVGGKPIEIYRKPKAITLPNGDQLPANWMQLFSVQDKAEKHIFPISTTTYDPTQLKETGNYTYSFDGTTITETPETIQLDLNTYKNNKTLELKAKYWDTINAPVIVNFGGTDYAFDTSGEEKDLLFQIRTAVNSGGTFPTNLSWASIDYDDGQNTYTETLVANISEANFNQIVTATIVRDRDAHTQFITKRKAVNDAVDHTAVDAIVWV